MEENVEKTANKILDSLEGKSFGFIKAVIKQVSCQLEKICIVPKKD